MKKLLVLLCAVMMLLSACGKSEEVAEQATEIATEIATEVATEAATEKPKEIASVKETKTRPIAVMIDNDNKDSRPHAGVEDAFLIYEMYVEGTATRMMAIFKDTKTEKIGPVRSSRHYFLDYALEHDPIYVHYGYSPKAASDIPALGVNNINGVADGGSIFWRERKYENDWHSAYTSIEKIMNFATGTKKYKDQTDALVFKRNAEDVAIEGEALNKLTIPYASFYKASYEYDKNTNTYKRFINGSGHVTQAGVHLAPKNIVIQKVKNFALAGDDKGRQDFTTVGSGEGYFITGGKIAEITWEKSDRKGKTTYKFKDGKEISLNPGQTWVQIVPPSMELIKE